MLSRIDIWLGKTMFVPLIIRACQRVRISQHSFNRICWFVASLVGLYNATDFWGKVLFGGFALIACLMAALLPDSEEATSRLWFRLTIVFFAAFSVPQLDWHIPYNLLVLFAEYAATIKTIPPLESKEKRAPMGKLARERA